jgi:hypothetical protein
MVSKIDKCGGAIAAGVAGCVIAHHANVSETVAGLVFGAALVLALGGFAGIAHVVGTFIGETK